MSQNDHRQVTTPRQTAAAWAGSGTGDSRRDRTTHSQTSWKSQLMLGLPRNVKLVTSRHTCRGLEEEAAACAAGTRQ